ncbi:MAG: SAM-dependent methyltransferase [Ponticaulis sp.]|nr:SAM-dependent methyltransferase [Ponticaulis sp.]
MKPSTNQDERFWDKIAVKYAQKPVADEAAYQQKLEMTREYFTPESLVLEFGCGTGSTAIAHAPFVKHIVASDISGEMIAIAERKAIAAQANNVLFVRADLTELPDREGEYDVVMGHSILHLVRDPQAVMSRVYRVLKPGGVFVSSTACLDEMGFWKLALPIARAFGKAPHVNIFSREGLISEMTGQGFDLVHQWQPKKGAAVFLIARKPIGNGE